MENEFALSLVWVARWLSMCSWNYLLISPKLLLGVILLGGWVFWLPIFANIDTLVMLPSCIGVGPLLPLHAEPDKGSLTEMG